MTVNLFRHSDWHPLPKIRVTRDYMSLMWGDVFFSCYWN